MFNDSEKKEMEAIVKKAVNELLENSGVNEAAQTINNNQRITKEEIMEERDANKRQQLIRENMDLFKEEA